MVFAGDIGHLPDSPSEETGEAMDKKALWEVNSEEWPSLRCGTVELAGDAVGFRVWVPFAKRVELVRSDGATWRYSPMTSEGRGYFARVEEHVEEGERYAFRLDGEKEYPDPCSLWQPEGPHFPSAVVRPRRFRWNDRDWKGVARSDLAIYELHVGTFTKEGTFDGVIPRLAELRELGITAIEIMPVGQFPGKRNWGYDGVHPYAVQNSYGGPHGLQRLVDACHREKLAVILDVVYNHLGPEGNYLGRFGPYFTDRYTTPWGQAMNYDGPGTDAVRQFVLDNVRMWLADYHVDGLRLDAVHSIFDFSARHIVQEIEELAEAESRRIGRPVHIIAESDLNDPRLLRPREQGGYSLAAQWSDDFHHAVHAYLTGERHTYYADFGTAQQLAQAMERPFVYSGRYSTYRDRRHGAPADGLLGDRFVVCLQNHDQIGNRPRGERLATILGSAAKLRLAASLMLLSPYLPLIFMGEEYGEESPFPFFCSFSDPELTQQMRLGRRVEFQFGMRHEKELDPTEERTFELARLRWEWPEGSSRSGLRLLYSDLLAARRAWPPLANFDRPSARLIDDGQRATVLELVRRATGDRSDLALLVYFNLSELQRPLSPIRSLSGYRLVFGSESPRYGGDRTETHIAHELLPYECLAFEAANL